MKRSLLLLLSCWACTAAAQLARLGDLNTSPARPFPPTVNQSFVMAPAIGGVSVFAGGSPAYGVELWRTDGTASGTLLVKDLVPGLADSNPRDFVILNGAWYFFAGSPQNSALYRTDGTATGTVELARLVAPSRLTLLPDRLAFLAGEIPAAYSYQPGAGTPLRLVGLATTGDAGLSDLAAFGNKLVFSGAFASEGWELGSYDVVAGSSTVLDLNPGLPDLSPFNLFSSTLGIFFAGSHPGAGGNELVLTDGTAGGSRLVQEINPSGSLGSSPRGFAEFSGKVYFAADEGPASGVELWCSDGTSASRVADLNAGSASSLPNQLTPAGSLLYFRATTADAGANRLYAFDGGAVTRVADGLVSSMATASSGLVFGMSTDAGLEPWITNAAGTAPLGDLFPGEGSSLEPGWAMASSNGYAWFGARQPLSNGVELWRTAGMTGTTTRVTNSGPTSSNPAGLTRIGNQFFFTATVDASRRPWLTDGTTAGTQAITGFPQGASALPEGASPRPRFASGLVLFSGQDSDGGHTLWSYEPAGLAVVGRGGPFRISDFTAAGGNVFYALEQDAGVLYVAPLDGGATLPLSGMSRPSALAAFQGGVLFAAHTPATGVEPWISDGTQAGTRIVRDFLVGTGFLSSFPKDWVVSGNRAFYDCSLFFYGRAVCVTDGTELSTVAVLAAADFVGPSSMIPADGGVFFVQSNSLWFSDGNPDGGSTKVPGGYTNPKRVVPFKSGIAFSATGAFGLAGLFYFDGVSTSTIAPFPGQDYGVTQLASNGEMLVMRVATDAGNELWASDGTLELTARLGDVWPGPTGSAPAYGAELALSDTLLLTNAMDQNEDVEPWLFRFDRTPPVITPSVTGTQTDGGWYTSDVSISFTVSDPESPTVSSGCGPSSVTVDGPTSVACTVRSWGGTSSSTVMVNRDATAPAISCDGDLDVEAQSSSGAVVSFGPRQVTASDLDPAPQVTLSPPSGTLFPLEQTTVTATAMDRAGNTNTCTFKVQVSDRTPPTLTCPLDLTLTATSPSGAIATFEAVEVRDLVDPMPTVTYAPRSGSLLATGETVVVNVLARDSADNTAQCSFKITVTPATAGTGGGGGGGGGQTEKPGCGCTGAPAAWSLALGLLLARRRWQPRKVPDRV